MATLITNVTELQAMNDDLAGDYELANDIDATGFDFTQIGTFTGVLDGKGYKVFNFEKTINTTGYHQWGMIYWNMGIIRNLGIECVLNITSTDRAARGAPLVWTNSDGLIENCWASGTSSYQGTRTRADWSYAAGFVCINYGHIRHSYSTMSVSVNGRDASASGFVYHNYNAWEGEPTHGDAWALIEECYAIGNTSADGQSRAFADGFIGWPSSYGGYIAVVRNCYARGNSEAVHIDGHSYAAGFLSEDNDGGLIENCYSRGTATAGTGTGGFATNNSGTITNCFWDTQTSGQATSDGGTGKTTAEMKQIATFSGWNISATTTDLNNGYPYLGWQLGNSPTWYIYEESILPIHTDVEIVALEALRNIEMSAMGRVYTDQEGNLCYENRYSRQL